MSKHIVTNYTFDPAAKTVTFTDYGSIAARRVLMITNITAKTRIFQFGVTGRSGTAATNVLTLDFDTSAMSASDELQIFYDSDTADQHGREVASPATHSPALNFPLGTVRTQHAGHSVPGWTSTDTSGNQVDVVPAQYVADWTSVRLSLTGTWTGTVFWYVSEDGKTWFNLNLDNIAGQSQAETSQASTNNAFAGSLWGFPYFKVTAAITVGSVAVGLGYSTATYAPQALAATTVGAAADGAATRTVNPVRIAGDDGSLVRTLRTDTAGLLLIKQAVGSGNAASTSRTVTTAGTNAASVKASGATLYGVHFINDTASAAYLKIYGKASAPTVGTDVPLRVVKLEANTSKSITYTSMGVAVGTGLAIAVTGSLADTDTSAAPAGINVTLDYA